MKFFEPTEKRNTVAAYVFLVALFCVLCVIIGINIKLFPKLLSYLYNVVKPVLYGFIIAFLMRPIVRLIETRVLGNRKEKKAGFRHLLSVVLAYVIVIALIFLFCVTAIPQLVDSYDGFEKQFLEYVDIFRNKTAELVNSTSRGESIYLYTEQVPELKKDIMDGIFATTLRDFCGTQYNAKSTSIILEVRNIFDDTLTAISEMISSSLPTLFSSAVTVVTETMNWLIGVFISLYLLLGERTHIKRISFVLKAWLSKKAYTRVVWLADKAKNIFRDYITVRLFDGFITGILMYICLFIFQVDYRIFLAVIMGFASFFPFIGPIVGISFGTVLMLFVDFRSAITYLIISVVLNLLDSRYVEPLLNSGRDEYTLPAIWVFSAIVIMGGFFGVIGILIGIPLFAFIYSIIKDLCEKKLTAVEMPTDTREYFDVSVSLGKKECAEKSGITDDALDMLAYYDERREIEQENADTAKEALNKLTGVFKRKKDKKQRKLDKSKKREDENKEG